MKKGRAFQVRVLTGLFAALCALFLFAGCGSAAERPQTNPDQGTQAEEGADSSQPSEGAGEETEVTMIELFIYDNRLEITLEQNATTAALIELLRQGELTYTADDYGNFEKVGDLGHSLPAEDGQLQTRPGDVILYNGRSLVLFYGTNSWSYTRIGRIEGYTAEQLRTLLGAGRGSAQVTLRLP